MSGYGLGKKQREIRAAMRAGANLEQDGLGHFWLVREGVRTSVPDTSCQGLHHRGIIKVSKQREDPRFIGGRHIWYELTEQKEVTP